MQIGFLVGNPERKKPFGNLGISVKITPKLMIHA